jgi:hypothetical protein
MGNRKARELMLQQEQDSIWHRIRTEPRSATQDVHARGIGGLRMQLIVSPSFEEARAWDVRQGPEGWCLFRPRVLQGRPELQFVGYDRQEFPPERLSSYFERIIALSIPIAPDLSGYGGVDGTMHQLAVFGDMWSSWRFQWWSDSPSQWRPLVDIASEMFAAFSATER